MTRKMMADDFWADYNKAQNAINVMNENKQIIEGYERLTKSFRSLKEDLKSLETSYDAELAAMLEAEYEKEEEFYQQFELKVLLSGEYDHLNAIVEIHPGAGGTEAQDWAEMLYRMYTRYASKAGFKVICTDYEDGDEAGIKTVTFIVQGSFAYGYLRSEKGVHRLVRISPFDSAARRHTSFASVEVIPQFDNDNSVVIDPNDLEIETHRASGAGGQHINKTDSAVRIIHKPTGIVATCQSERSQLQNKEQALNILKSRLYERQLEEKAKAMKQVIGEVKANEWGSQIRSYVMCPYTLVKDNRSNYEETNVDAVLEGNIENFIYNYLKSQREKQK